MTFRPNSDRTQLKHEAKRLQLFDNGNRDEESSKEAPETARLA